MSIIYDLFFSIITISIILAIIIFYIVKKIKKETNISYLFILFFSISYFLFLFFILFDARNTNGNGLDFGNFSYFQLLPFKSILSFIKNNNLMQIYGNIIIFLPFSILIYLLFRNLCKFRVIFISLLFVLLVEPIQLVINLITNYPNHVIDIDDFILNLIGVLAGYYILLFISKYTKILK